MAGLVESCSYVAAILFYVEYAARLRDGRTVAEKNVYWSKPDTKKELNLVKSKTLTPLPLR